MVKFANATLRFDGSCNPNPGEGGGGYVIFNNKNGKTIIEGRYYVGHDCTSNVAEYFGLIAALKRLRCSPHYITHLSIEGDSELVINHLNYTYQIRSNRLRPLLFNVRNLISKCEGREFGSCSFSHIDRYDNERADELARDAVIYEDEWSADYY